MREGNELLANSRVFCHAELFDHARLDTRFSPFVWLNLVCLDAPIVAVTWQWLFARTFHISLSMAPRVALFLTAWLIYLADRFVDTLSLAREGPKSLRQRFCQDHGREWVAMVAAIALIDSWLILRHLDGCTFLAGLVIGSLSVVYLTINYWLGRIWRIFPVKEICIGFLFAIGTVAALIPNFRHGSVSFVGSFFLFAFLCSLNCISLAVWERKLDQAQNKNSLATSWPGVGRYLKPSAVVLVGLCAAFALLPVSPVTLISFVGVSALLLGALDLMRDAIPRDQRTALADLVLLAPIILLVFRFAA
jgi:hypothetical protein